jgi:hypothetical protein
VTNPDSHVPEAYLVKASLVLGDAQLQRLREGIDRQVEAADAGRDRLADGAPPLKIAAGDLLPYRAWDA